MSDEHTRFTEVYSEYLGPIRAYLARRVPFGDVEDLSADVFAVAWKKQAQVTPGEELPWLYRIASFVVANYRRREQNRLNVLWFLREPDSAPSADSFVEGDPELSRAWSALPVVSREALALVVIDGLGVADAARVMGISANALSVRLHRAKKTLAHRLETLRSER
jgi:RNA polymerase sigma-70 factor (ECF subfamily)